MAPSIELDIMEPEPCDSQPLLASAPTVHNQSTTLDGGPADPTSQDERIYGRGDGSNTTGTQVCAGPEISINQGDDNDGDDAEVLYIRQKTLSVRFKRISYNNCKSHAKFYKGNPDIGTATIESRDEKRVSQPLMPPQEPPPSGQHASPEHTEIAADYTTAASTPTEDTADNEVVDILHGINPKSAGIETTSMDHGPTQPKTVNFDEKNPLLEMTDADKFTITCYKERWKKHAETVMKSKTGDVYSKTNLLDGARVKRAVTRCGKNLAYNKRVSVKPSTEKQVVRYVVLETHLYRKKTAPKPNEDKAEKPEIEVREGDDSRAENSPASTEKDSSTTSPTFEVAGQHKHQKSSSFDHDNYGKDQSEHNSGSTSQSSILEARGDHLADIVEIAKNIRQKQVDIRAGRVNSASTSSSKNYPERAEVTTEMAATESARSDPTPNIDMILGRSLAEKNACLLRNSPGMLKFYKSEAHFQRGEFPVEIVPMDRVWACYQRDFESKKHSRYRLELFTDDGFITLCFDDDETLHAWYKELNDEVSSTRDSKTHKLHVDSSRPSDVYSTHHEVRVRRITEVTDPYGTIEQPIEGDQREEIARFLGDRWLCFAMDKIHLIKPIYHEDPPKQKPAKKKKNTAKENDPTDTQPGETNDDLIMPSVKFANALNPHHNSVQVPIAHDNLIMFKRGKKYTVEKPWLTIIMGLKDTLFSWQQKESRERYIKSGKERQAAAEESRQAYSPSNPYSGMAGRRGIFRDPETEFPDNEDSVYVKIQLQVKDWDYCAKIHDEFADWKRRLSTRYNCVASSTVDAHGNIHHLHARDFYKIKVNDINQLSNDELFCFRLRMLSHANPDSVPASKLVLQELQAREKEILLHNKKELDISDLTNKGSYELGKQHCEAIREYTKNLGPGSKKIPGGTEKVTSPRKELCDDIFPEDQIEYDDELCMEPEHLLGSTENTCAAASRVPARRQGSKDTTPSAPTSTPPPLMFHIPEPVSMIATAPNTAKVVPAERWVADKARAPIGINPKLMEATSPPEDVSSSSPEYIIRQHLATLQDDMRNLTEAQRQRPGHRAVFDGLVINDIRKKQNEVLQGFDKAIGDFNYPWTGGSVNVVSHSPPKPITPLTQESIEERPLFPPERFQTAFASQQDAATVSLIMKNSPETESTRLTESTTPLESSTVSTVRASTSTSTVTPRGAGKARVWDLLSNDTEHETSESESDDNYITAR